MSGQVIYNVPHAIAFGWSIAVYFLVTGLSAGSFLVAVLPRLLGQGGEQRQVRIAAALAPILAIVAPLFLITDLEQPARFYRVLIYSNPTSPISYGAYILPLYAICAVLYWYFSNREPAKHAKAISALTVVGIPLAVALEAYTGMILGVVRSRELWNSALMPVLFLVSALISGIALTLLVSALVNRKPAAEEKAFSATLGKALGCLLILELFMLLSEVLVLSAGQVEARAAAQLLLSGALAPWFLGVEVGLGSVVPLFVVFNKRTASRTGWQALAAVLVLLGVVAMRFVLVFGGQMTPLS